MRQILFSGVMLVVSAIIAYAEGRVVPQDEEGRVIPRDIVLEIVELVRSHNCIEDCIHKKFHYRRVELSSDVDIGERSAYQITDHRDLCGSAGCPAAIIAIGKNDVHYLIDGPLGVNLAYIEPRPLSSETLVSTLGEIPSTETYYETENVPRYSTGPLCKEARNPLSTRDMQSIFWGSKLIGISIKGKSWTEYLLAGGLQEGGDISNTIFVNSSGKEFIGVYTIRDEMICFSYGKVSTWRCKKVSRCHSGEGEFVVYDLEGNQTSIIKDVEPEGAALYHYRRWDILSSQQHLVVPPRDRNQYTQDLPTNTETVVSKAEAVSPPENCSGIENDVARLKCYDRKARTPATDTKSLDRASVAALILASPSMQERRRNIHLTTVAFKEGIRQRWYTPNGAWKLYPSPSVASIISGGLPGGKLIYLTPQAAQDVSITVNVTGITQPQANTAIADFNWDYSQLPNLFEAGVRRGTNGRAVLLLYDDGWRVDSVISAIGPDKCSPEADRRNSQGMAFFLGGGC